MRPIKFRAWHKTIKKIFVMELICFPKYGHFAYTVSDGDGKLLGTEEDFELMQFTGLHDKNGKEIWEGDVVRGDRVYVNNYDEECEREKGLVGVVKFGDSGISEAAFYVDGITESLIKCEVIGDIHENPELLNQSGGIQ